MLNPLEWLPSFLGVAGGTAVAANRMRGKMKDELEKQPNPLPAPEERKEVIFDNISNLLKNTNVRFTPISVILTDKRGRTVYMLPTEEFSPEDYAAYMNKDEQHFQELFGRRALLSVQAAELAFTRDMLSNFGSIQADPSKLASFSYEFDSTPIPSEVWRGNYKTASIFSLFGSSKPKNLGFSGIPLEVQYTPDAVLFFSGETTLGYIPYTQMGEKTRAEFRAKNNPYFRELFRNLLDDANAKIASLFSPFEKSASIVKENFKNPVATKEWLDTNIHEWSDFSPEVLMEVIADELELGEVPPLLESTILALGSIVNEETYREDPVVLEKLLNVFGGNVVDFTHPQPIDSIVTLAKGLYYLDVLTEDKLDLNDKCLQTLGDFLFSCGYCINPFNDMFVEEDNEFLKKYLTQLWLPAVDDVVAVQEAVRLTFTDPSQFEESLKKLSPEGKYLLKSCLGNYKAIRKVVAECKKG